MLEVYNYTDSFLFFILAHFCLLDLLTYTMFKFLDFLELFYVFLCVQYSGFFFIFFRYIEVYFFEVFFIEVYFFRYIEVYFPYNKIQLF